MFIRITWVSQKYLKITQVQNPLSLLLCCCLHLWHNFSSIPASLLLPDPLPPQDMSAPSIAGGTAAPHPMGGTSSRAPAETCCGKCEASLERDCLIPSIPKEIAPQSSLEMVVLAGWGQLPARLAALCSGSRLAQQLVCAGCAGGCHQQLSTFVFFCCCYWKVELGALSFSDIQFGRGKKKVSTTILQNEVQSGGYSVASPALIWLFSWSRFLGFLQSKLKLSTLPVYSYPVIHGQEGIMSTMHTLFTWLRCRVRAA